ncbi:prepilin peptidase, partial [Salmonella enterica]|nr:prepilin peptidase [Salmonella enterica]
MKTLIATAFPVEYALPVMVSAALMSRLILIPVRRFLTGQGCGVNARLRTAEATGIWAMAVAAMLFCLAQAPLAERVHALLMSGFLLQLGVCDAASGWLPRQMTVAFLVAGLLASAITEP